MKNINIALLIPLLFVPTLSTTQAEEFTVIVSVTATIDEIPNVIHMTQPMEFPPIEVSQATLDGALCYTTKNETYGRTYASNINSMCPNRQGYPASYTITGSPNALINYKRGAEIQVIGGIQFHTNSYEAAIRLNSVTGEHSDTLYGYLKLIDRTQTYDGDYAFTYEVSAVYQ